MRRRLVVVTSVLLFLVLAPALAQVPSTDIFLLAVDGDGVGSPRRVTDREGYDNQPQFLPDGKGLVYSSLRDGGTDIYLYDPATEDTRVVVQTPQSEYSPTPVPGRNAISVVRDYGDLKQQLWSYPLDGGEPDGSFLIVSDSTNGIVRMAGASHDHRISGWSVRLRFLNHPWAAAIHSTPNAMAPRLM